MNVLITGAAGFLGRRLAKAVLERGELMGPSGTNTRIDEVRLLDVAVPQPGSNPRVRVLAGDISDPSVVDAAIDTNTASIFHLAAIVSGEAEADFDLGLRVNLDGTRLLLDVCRARDHRPRFVFASSVAVYGGRLPDEVTDETRLTPQSSYGTEKAIGELLVNDYSRRGFVDGRALRLPTISVRPGRPNAALSSFASGIIREPLNGQPAVCPVSPSTIMWLLSPETMTRCFLVAHDLDGGALGSDRSVIVPGLAISVADMLAALGRVAGTNVTSLVRFEPDARVQRIANTWPGRLDAARAIGLGFPVDRSFDEIIQQYLDKDVNGR